MHNTPLDLRLWEYCMNRIPESGQSIHRYDHDILYTSVFCLVEDGQPVFCTFISSYPHAEDLTFSVQFNTYSNVNCLFYRSIVLPNMEMYRIHKNNGIFSFQRPVLPFFCDRKDSICHMWYHFCGCIHTINIFEMSGDISCRHSFCIHRKYLIFNVWDICLILFHNLRFKISLSISWYIQINRSHWRGDSFRTITITAIVCLFVLVVILGISKVIIHFSF